MALKFSNVVKSVILEQGRYEILRDRFTKPKKRDEKVIPPKLSVEKFDEIVKADPTTRRDGDDIKKAGTYVQWLLKQFMALGGRAQESAEYGTPAYKGVMSQLENLFFEDLYKTTEDLEKFERFKRQIDQSERDINKHTIDSLFELVKDFSLEKSKATKDDKKEAAKTYEYPGSKVIHRGPQWTVIEIEDQGQLGKDAACFFGGYNQETRWCTSAPGLSYFNTYIKQGPLYVLLRNSSEGADKTGLPKERFQFHFPSNQFMDINDRQIDLVGFLNENDELKELFKPEFAKGFQKGGMNSKQVVIDYPRDSSSKYLALYGFDDLFEQLPRDIKRFDFVQSSGGYYGADKATKINLELPNTIGEFKDLEALNLDGVVSSLPEGLGELKNLMFLSLPNNPNLKSIPKSVVNLPNLAIINLKGSNSDIDIPEEVSKKAESSDLIIVK